MTSSATSVIDVAGLRKRYGPVEALSDLTMTVRPGEVFGFLGPNGAGKTTTVKLLLGLARPSGGSGRVLGAPLGDREARRRIGYLPELFRVIYGLEPPILIAAAQGQPLAEANPFFAATPPPVGFLVWVVTWTVIVLSLAALSLRRREL